MKGSRRPLHTLRGALLRLVDDHTYIVATRTLMASCTLAISFWAVGFVG